jgi:hypothetical protein
MVFVIYVLCSLWLKDFILNSVICLDNLLKFQWTVMKLNARKMLIFAILSFNRLYIAIVVVSNFRLGVSTNRCGQFL